MRKGTQDSFYIAKALSATKDSPFQVELQDVSQGDALDLTKFSGVVVSNVSRVPAKLAGSIAEFVRGGGGLIIALGNRTRNNNLSETLDKVLPASLGKASTGADSKTHFIGEMQKQHPVFAGIPACAPLLLHDDSVFWCGPGETATVQRRASQPGRRNAFADRTSVWKGPQLCCSPLRSTWIGTTCR